MTVAALWALWALTTPEPQPLLGTTPQAEPHLATQPQPQAPPVTWSVPIGHSLALLGGMRLSMSLIWPQAFAARPLDARGRQFARSWGGPPKYDGRRSLLESDGDPWTVNVVGHGLFGAEVYGRVRACGGSPLAALAFTTGTSVAWEYGVEAFSQRPSAVDLIATPLLGLALGEGRHHLRGWLRTRRPGFWRSFAEILVDPLGEAERGWLGTRC